MTADDEENGMPIAPDTDDGIDTSAENEADDIEHENDVEETTEEAEDDIVESVEEDLAEPEDVTAENRP